MLCPSVHGQTFKNVDYLYRATDDTKPVHVMGVLRFDSANKAMTFIPHADERYSLIGKVHKGTTL